MIIPDDFFFTLSKVEFEKPPKVNVDSKTTFHAKRISKNEYLITWKSFFNSGSRKYCDYEVLSALNERLWLIKD